MNKLTQSKTIVVYNYDHVMSAMKAALKLKKKIIIESPTNCAAYMGPSYFKQLLKKGKSLFPGVNCIEILDCGNDTGLALEAIDCGIEHIKIKCNRTVLKKIKNICKKKDLVVNNISKKKLDLKYVEDGYSECLKWLNS